MESVIEINGKINHTILVDTQLFVNFDLLKNGHWGNQCIPMPLLNNL